MNKQLATLAIHGTNKTPRGVVVPDITLSSTFEREEDGTIAEGQDIYSRASNPNRRLLEEKLAAFEGGTIALAFASGQAATMSIFHCFGGKHVLLPDDIYYGSKALVDKLYQQRNLTFTTVDMTNIEAIEAAITPETALIWIETPSNPQLKITDIEAVVALAKKYSILTAADNTWATSFFTQPFDWGIDLVMHSTTKYLGGHSDILGGCVVLNEASEHLAPLLRDYQHLGGAVPSPFDCWLLNRSLSTFPIRMPVHAKNAMKLAFFLEKHPKILAVNYPGLPSNRFHEVAKKQMKNGFGGMLSVLVDATEANTMRLASSMQIFKHATSLGGVESLIEHRRSSEGSFSQSPPNLLRISVGIEAIEDLIADFDNALSDLT